MTQISFDPLNYEGGVEEAKRERDEYYRSLKARGITSKRWVLKNQLKKYASFGVEDGRVRDVYFLDIKENGRL